MIKAKLPVPDIIKDLADGRRRPFSAFGKEWQGDIFYSDIDRVLRSNYGKHYPYSLHSQVCRGLEAEGFYVHS